MTEAALDAARKRARWGAALAAQLKQTAQVRNAWFAKPLHLGQLGAVSS